MKQFDIKQCPNPNAVIVSVHEAHVDHFVKILGDLPYVDEAKTWSKTSLVVYYSELAEASDREALRDIVDGFIAEEN